MEYKATLKNIYQNVVDDCYEVVFQMQEPPTKLMDKISGLFRLKVTRWSEKRSLDANAYFWQLATKIAEVLKTSKEEVYEECLQKYGYLDEPPITITVKAEVDMSRIDGHWKFIKSDGKFSAYIRIRGTSEYDSREMAHFIDMVIQDAKELGIETLPPEEIERMKQAWGDKEDTSEQSNYDGKIN